MKKIFKILLLILIIALVIGGVFIGCTYSPVDIDAYVYNDNGKSSFVSTDGEVYEEFGEKNNTPVALDEIPEDLINGIIAVEDSRFYKHSGVDIRGIIRAFFTNVKSGEIEEGASTITQQIARNIFPEITTQKTLSRKITEAITALRLERKYTKDQILEIYLNEIYLGAGTVGVQEASQEYFGKDVWDLNLAECAMIAGLPQAPSAYAPNDNFELAKKRQEKVIDRMVDMEFISQEDGENAKLQEITIVDNRDTSDNKIYFSYIDRVIDEFTEILKKKYPNDIIDRDYAINLLNTQGLTIQTTIDTKMQQTAYNSLNASIEKHNLSATGAFVTIDSDSGDVLAYYGGNTYVDMAKEARQPGSSIKPLIYVQAFQEKILNGNSILLDQPTEGYPKNYNSKYYGYVTAREAIVESMNVEAAKTMEMVGINKAVEGIKKFGITTIDEKDYGIASATGGLTYGISPFEMVQAYGVFPQKGVLTEAYFIKNVIDSDGNMIYEKLSGDKSQIIDPEAASDVSDILVAVVNRGTGKAARSSYITGGKTGTTNDKTDLWFVGYTGQIATSIWIGNPDRTPINNGYSSYAAEVYGSYIKQAINDKLISTESMGRISTYDDTQVISILNPLSNNIDTNNITENQVIRIKVPASQLSYFENLMVVQVAIDKETEKLFNEGRCPEDNKEMRYYILGEEPQELCDKSHFFDKIEDFFNNSNNNENDNNSIDSGTDNSNNGANNSKDSSNNEDIGEEN